MMQTDGGREVTLPPSYLSAGHLTHAYAMTGHKAQGMTTYACFALGDDTLYKEWGYAALSRGKSLNRLYLVGDTTKGERRSAARSPTSPTARPGPFGPSRAARPSSSRPRNASLRSSALYPMRSCSSSYEGPAPTPIGLVARRMNCVG